MLKNSNPEQRSNWLAAGADHVKHLTDADHVDAIQYLFKKAPYPVGVLNGPTVTGKTSLLGEVNVAHVLGNNSTHLVGAPSNDAADVVASVVSGMFHKNNDLKGKIVIRAHHEATEKDLIFGTAKKERKITLKAKFPSMLAYVLKYGRVLKMKNNIPLLM